MGRWRCVFGWMCWAFVVAFVAFARPARADDAFSAIHVCVRPANVPPTTAAWVFTGGTASWVVTILPKDFKKQAGDLAIYVFDPYAPPDSVKRFPKQYTNLVCPPPPPKPVVPPPAPAKKEEPPKAGDSSAGTWGALITPGAKGKDKKDKADEPPPGTPAPLTHPPPEEWHPSPPKGGVTEHWPHSVLPIRKAPPPPPSLLPSVESGHGVLPIAGLDGKGRILPMANRVPPPASEPKPAPSDAVGTAPGTGGDGTKKGDAVAKTAYEKWCEQIGLAGGLASLNLGEDIKAPNGSKYGIPGGKNPNGIKSPTAQAAAGAVMVAAAVITAGGFDKKLYDALKKGTPFFIRGGGKAAEQAAEKLVQDALAAHGAHGAEDLAAALAANGVIGEYSVMAKFTQGLGAKWQAHHILEVKMAKDLNLAVTDRLPAVILSDVQHKAITKRLAATTGGGTKTTAELWAAYQKAYKDHPLWLAAIKRYFEK